MYRLATVVVQCSQMGKQHTVKVKDLSREDNLPLSHDDLEPKMSLILQYKGKPWPVSFVKYKGKKKKHDFKS